MLSRFLKRPPLTYPIHNPSAWLQAVATGILGDTLNRLDGTRGRLGSRVAMEVNGRDFGTELCRNLPPRMRREMAPSPGTELNAQALSAQPPKPARYLQALTSFG